MALILGIMESYYNNRLLLQALVDAGVIPGADMTPEAALMKLGYVLTKDMDVERKRKVTPQLSASSFTLSAISIILK